MSRMGRPLKGNERKDCPLQLRLTKGMMNKIRECSEILGVSRTEVIEKAVTLLHGQLKK